MQQEQSLHQGIHFKGIRLPSIQERKKKLAEGKPLKVVTTQIDGTFKATAGSGKYAPGTEVEWSQVTDTMMQRTARLLLETPNETLDRRVAAPSTDEVVGISDKNETGFGYTKSNGGTSHPICLWSQKKIIAGTSY